MIKLSGAGNFNHSHTVGDVRRSAHCISQPPVLLSLPLSYSCAWADGSGCLYTIGTVSAARATFAVMWGPFRHLLGSLVDWDEVSDAHMPHAGSLPLATLGHQQALS